MPDRIDIIIKRPDRERRKVRGAGVPKDIGSRRRQVEALPRRLRKGGLINFYDLAQKRTGSSWTDILFEYAPGYDILTAFVDPFPSIQYQSLVNSIFTVDPSDWASEYRKLEYEEAEKYGIRVITAPEVIISGDDIDAYYVARIGKAIDLRSGHPNFGNLITETNWTENGFVRPDDLGPKLAVVSKVSATFSTVQTSGFTNGFNQARSKVTIEPSYAADEVEFELAATNVDIFLMPSVLLEVSRSGGLDVSSSILIGKYKTVPRELYLPLVSSGSETPVYDGLPVLQAFALKGPGRAEVVANRKSDGVFYYSADEDGIITYYPVANYPISPTENNVGFQPVSFPPSEAVSNAPVGAFIGAIRQNGQIFFFWRDEDFSGAYGEGTGLAID